MSISQVSAGPTLRSTITQLLDNSQIGSEIQEIVIIPYLRQYHIETYVIHSDVMYVVYCCGSPSVTIISYILRQSWQSRHMI